MDAHAPFPVQVVIDGDRMDLPEDASDTAMEVDSDSQSTSVGSTSLSQPRVGAEGNRSEGAGGNSAPVAKEQCPSCHNFFERLHQHLRPRPGIVDTTMTCRSTPEGIAALEELTNRKKHKKYRPRSTASRSPPSAVTAAAAKGPNGTVNGGAEGGVANGSAPSSASGTSASGVVVAPVPVVMSPCPACGLCFQRLSAHLSLSSCRAIKQKPAGSSIQCFFCGESVKVGIRLLGLLEHAERCVPGKSKAAELSAMAEARKLNGAGGSQGVDKANGTSAQNAASCASVAVSNGHASGSGSANGSQAVSSATQVSLRIGVPPGSCLPTVMPSGSAGPRAAKRAKPGGMSGPSSAGGRGGGRRGSPSPPPSPPSGGGGANVPGGGRGGGCRDPALDRSSSADLSSAAADWGGDGLVSDSESDGDQNDAGGGSLSGSISGGGGVLRATRKPLPPMRRWEADLELWAQRKESAYAGGEAGGIDVPAPTRSNGKIGVVDDNQSPSEESPPDDPDRGLCNKYPLLMKRARDSTLATVKEVKRSGGDRAGRESNGALGEEVATRQLEALMECRLIADGHAELKQALSPWSPRASVVVGGKAGPPPASEAIAAVLGLEVAPASSSRGTSESEFPVVSLVTPGGPAARAGVVQGSSILEVDRASMSKKVVPEVLKAMVNSLRRKDRGKTNQGGILLTILTPPWRSVPGEGERASGAGDGEGGKLWGGMARLGGEESRSREFAELSWSVLLGPDGGIPSPSKLGNGELSMGERPAEQEDQVIYRMGFHVERRELAGGMECIQVASVEPEGLAARHGLRVRDLILALNGKHLLSTSETSFYMEIGRRMQEVDACRLRRRRSSTEDDDRQPRGEQVSAGDVDDSSWLRFLVVRKGTTSFPPSPVKNGFASSIFNGAGGRGGVSRGTLAGLRLKPPVPGRGMLPGKGSLPGRGIFQGRGAPPGRGGAGRGIAPGRGDGSVRKRDPVREGFKEKVAANGMGAKDGAQEAESLAAAKSSNTTREEGVASPWTRPTGPAPAPSSKRASVAPSKPIAPASAANTTVVSGASTIPKAVPVPESEPTPVQESAVASKPSLAPPPPPPPLPPCLSSTAGTASEREPAERESKESAAGARRRARDCKKRPAWWPSAVKGSHRTVLRLRPANALPGAVPGDPVPPGAYLVEDAHLGNVMTIPAGAKLVSVDNVLTADLPFERAREVALSAGKDASLAFE